MRMGLTYDLQSEYLAQGYGEEETAEFDRDDTIEAIEGALAELGHQTERIGNARNLVKALARGATWDLVFNIAEGLHGVGREAQVPAILDVYGIPYTFSDPLVLSLTLHKGMTKRVIRDAGLATAPFLVVEPGESVPPVPFPPPYFVKPVAEGTGKGVSPESLVGREEDLAGVCTRLAERFHQPVLVEGFLAGREFTVGIVGTGSKAEALGAIEVVLGSRAEPGMYSYGNKKHYEDRVEYRLCRGGNDPLIAQVEALALSAYKALGCRDAGRVDVRCDGEGRPHFLEINPLAGIHPVISDLPIICSLLKIPYVSLIGRIVASALERVR
jgi:D-alanine-D-alanine ligase